MPLLFSYGSLQEERIQLATFGRCLAGSRDELVGFAPETVPAGHHNARHDGQPGSRVGGTAFEVTEEELAAADVYEQPPNYKRVVATLASGRRAWVYVHAPTAPA